MTRRGIRRLAALAGITTIGAALLAGAFFVRTSIREQQARDAYERGMVLYQPAREMELSQRETLRDEGARRRAELQTGYEAEYAAALPELGDAIARIKDDPELLKAFAVCRLAVKLPNDAHYSQAIGVTKAAIDLAPDDIEAKSILLDAYWEAGYLPELVDLAEKVLESDPQSYRTWLRLIVALEDLRRHDRALASAERFCENFPDSLVAQQRWEFNAERLRTPETERTERVRGLEPRFSDRPAYFMWLAEFEQVLENIAEAEAALRKAAALPPRSAAQIDSLVKKMREIYRIKTARNPDADLPSPTLLELADRIYAESLRSPIFGSAVAGQATKRNWWENRTEKARDFASRIGSEPAPVDAWWASLVLIGDQPTKGVPLESLSLAPLAEDSSEAQRRELLAAMDGLRGGDHERVARELSVFSSEDRETQAVADYIRGIALHRMGDYRSAAISLRSAAEASGIDRDRAWKALGDTFVAEGDFDSALGAYRSMSDRAANSELTRFDNALDLAERYDDAALANQLLQRMVEIGSTSQQNPTIQVRVARALVLGGEIEQGANLARELANADPPPDPIGLIGLLNALRLNAPDVGLELAEAFTTRSEEIQLLAYRAAQLAEAGRIDEGRAALQAEIDQRSPEQALPYRRALVWMLDGIDADDAFDAARQLSDDYPASGAAQLTALESRAIWDDTDAARLAISRLRDVVGDASYAWQTFNARVTLQSDPTDAELTQLLNNGEGGPPDLGDLLREAPDDYDALLLTARVHEMIAGRRAAEGRDDFSSRSYDQAVSYYDRASGPGLRAEAFLPYVNVLRAAGRTNEIDGVLDRFVAIEKLTPRARDQRRILLMESGRYADAAIDQELFLSIEKPATFHDLASLHIRAGDLQSAVRVLDFFLDQRDWGPKELDTTANLLMEAGAIARSIEIFKRLPDPHNGLSLDTVIARALMRTGNQRDALPYQLQAARVSGQIDDWVAAIRIAAATGDADLRNRTIREAVEANPDAAELAVFESGNQLRQQSLATATQASLELDRPATAESERPGWTALRDATRGHARGEIDDEALLERLAGVCRDHPAISVAWQLRIEGLIRVGRMNEAVETARGATDALPESAAAHRLLAQTLRRAGRLDDAVAPAERQLELSPGQRFEATTFLATIEADRGNHQRVIDLLAGYRDRLEIESIEEPSAGLSSLAIAFAGIGNTAESASLFRSRLQEGSNAWHRVGMLAVIALPAQAVDARRAWVMALTPDELALDRAMQFTVLANFSGDRADALQAIRLVDQFGSDQEPDWLWARSEAETLAGLSDQAEASLTRLRELVPDAPIVPAALGDLFSTIDGREPEALRVLDEAQGLDATGTLEDAIRVSRARAYLALGDAQRALDSLEPLLESPTPPASALVLVGRAQLKLGNPDEARRLARLIRTYPALSMRTKTELQNLNAALN